MPEYLHLPPVASALVAITGVVLAVVRLLTASKAFWWKFPEWVQKGLPALLVTLGTIPAAIENATSWLQIVEAGLLALGVWFTASRGDDRPVEPPSGTDDTVRVIPPALLILLLAGLSSHVVACKGVNWPRVLQCAGELQGPVMDSVTKVLNGTGDVESELEDVAREHGAGVVECAVQQVIDDLTSKKGYAMSQVETDAVSRGKSFLRKVSQ